MSGKGGLDVLVVSDRGEEPLVDLLAGLSLLDNAKYAVVDVVVKLLRAGKSHAACAADTGCFADTLLGCGRLATAGVGSGLLNVVDGLEVTLEDIGAVEALLAGATATRAEVAHHGALVVG